MSFIRGSSLTKTVNPLLDLSKLRVIPLADKKCLSRFQCGNWDIDGFAAKAFKFSQRNLIKVFAAHEGEAPWALGFYAFSLKMEDKRKLGTSQAQLYQVQAPLVYIDALGVRRTYQDQGLGRMLLIDALKRAYLVSQHVAVYGVALRSLNDRTTSFYEKHGFGRLDDEKHPLMVVPIWTLADLFEGGAN
jgi:GNAT superfamily N-acetyltransferase